MIDGNQVYSVVHLKNIILNSYTSMKWVFLAQQRKKQLVGVWLIVYFSESCLFKKKYKLLDLLLNEIRVCFNKKRGFNGEWSLDQNSLDRNCLFQLIETFIISWSNFLRLFSWSKNSINCQNFQVIFWHLIKSSNNGILGF